MADFASALDAINALADESPGFIWRLVSDGGNDATALRAPVDGVEQMVNMSLWTDRDALWQYVYRTEHVDFLRRRSEWFVPGPGPYVALWWVPSGHIPTVDEAVERLEHLRDHGATPTAFTFRTFFDPPA